MKFERLEGDFTFSLTTKQGKIFVNTEGEDLSVFLNEQKKDKENLLHWPGEYEKNGVATFLSDIGGEKFLGKIFVEHVRVVFFSDSGVEYTEELSKEFGNTDVLVFQKGENGLTESQTKKLLESIDPRMLIGLTGSTMDFLKKLSLPVLPKESLTFTKSTLPAEHTEYYVV